MIMKRALLLILLTATPALAQVRESVTVEVVEVPVYVTSSDGKPVRGLTKDAFELFVAGKKTAIDYFDAVDFAALPPEQPPVARPLRERRLYLLLFDLSVATPAKLARALKAAGQAVTHSNADTDLFAVATYSSNHGVQFLSPFLRDRVAIRRALYTLHASKARDPLGLALSSAERGQWIAARQPGESDSPDQEDAASLVSGEMAEALRGGQANQDALREPGNRLIEYQIRNLGDAAARLAALEGQKHLLVFTEGFDSTRVTDIKARSRPPNIDAELLHWVSKMHQTFVSAGVMLDSIDIKGLRHTFDDLQNDALYMLSRDTGGRVIANRNDLVEAVDALTTAQQVVYVLGFHRAGRKNGRISVHVNGVPRGTEVSYREGFGYVARSSGIDALQLADILINDVPQTGVTLDAGVRPHEGGAEVVLSFARAEVVPQLGREASVEIFIYLFDERGVSVAFKSKGIAFDAAARINSGSITLREPFELPKGRYSAKVLLRISGTSSLGFARRDFEVE